MTRHRYDEFVRELLRQGQIVSEDEYKEYRENLDQQITEVLRRGKRRQLVMKVSFAHCFLGGTLGLIAAFNTSGTTQLVAGTLTALFIICGIAMALVPRWRSLLSSWGSGHDWNESLESLEEVNQDESDDERPAPPAPRPRPRKNPPDTGRRFTENEGLEILEETTQDGGGDEQLPPLEEPKEVKSEDERPAPPAPRPSPRKNPPDTE